jgi:BlaI family penicillinase repressor
MKLKNHDLTEAEWAIIETIWKKEPCAAPTVQEELEHSRGWSYSTVKTLMDRMTQKGLLKTEKMRNLILYRTTITKEQAQKSEIMRAVKRAFNGALTPMMQFLLESDELSDKDINEIEQLIKNRKKNNK